MRLKIGLDIDGVVADSFPVFREELNKHYGKDVTKIDHHDISKVYDVAWDELSIFFDENMERMFSAAKPMKGSVKGILSLLEEGHEVIFVTARKNGAEEEVTLKWFERYEIPRDKGIFTGGLSKTSAVRKYGIDIFVDDFLTNVLEIASLGIPVLLLDAPYNQGVLPEGIIRCHSWEDILFHIEQFSKKKR